MNPLRNVKRMLIAAAALAALAVGGSAIASATTRATSTGTTTAPIPVTRTPSSPGSPPANMPAPGTAAHEDAETSVTGATASEVQAAAVKYVGSGTAGAVTTDYTHTGYEVTVTQSDGSTVDLHLDSSFNVIRAPAGPGPGGAGGAGLPGGGTIAG